jgi:hypothetical protein
MRQTHPYRHSAHKRPSAPTGNVNEGIEFRLCPPGAHFKRGAVEGSRAQATVWCSPKARKKFVTRLLR